MSEWRGAHESPSRGPGDRNGFDEHVRGIDAAASAPFESISFLVPSDPEIRTADAGGDRQRNLRTLGDDRMATVVRA